MPEKEVVDIRVMRSKKALSEAFIELLKDKDFKDITITEIVSKAGVNRGTFYKHYSYKEDILTDIQDHFFGNLTAMLEANYQDICYSSLKTKPLSEAFFVFIYENKKFFNLAIHSVGFLNFQMHFSAILKDFLIVHFFPNARFSMKSQNLHGAYIANGIFGCLVEWDEKNYVSSPVEMAQQLTDIFILDRSIFKLSQPVIALEDELVD